MQKWGIFMAQFKDNSVRYTWHLNQRGCYILELKYFHIFHFPPIKIHQIL